MATQTKQPGVSTRGRHAEYRLATRPGRESGLGNVNEIANRLGWFSIGLGLAELTMPSRLCRWIGLSEERNGLLRGLGLREIASGVGILSQREPAGFLWSRVAGDAMDLSLLGAALNADDNESRGRTLAAAAAVAGVTYLDYYCSKRMTLSPESGYRSVRATKSVTINRPAEELYRFWRNLHNLPQFMEHLESVQVIGDRRSHWKAKAPAGASIEWDAEITEDTPNSRIAWRSVEGSNVHNSGWVRFDQLPDNRGTVVRVEMQYDPPGGAMGAMIAKLFGEEPSQQLDDDLRHFKQIMETGEVVKSDASIHTGMHAAQPPSTEEARKERYQ